MTTGITPKSSPSISLQVQVKEANAAREISRREEEQRAKLTIVKETSDKGLEPKTQEEPKEYQSKPQPTASSNRNDGTLASRGIGQLIDVLV